MLPTRQPPRLASFRNRSTSSLHNKDAIEMEPCKIRSTTQPLVSCTELEGKKISSPSGRGRTMSLTSALIDPDFSTARIPTPTNGDKKQIGDREASLRGPAEQLFQNGCSADLIKFSTKLLDSLGANGEVDEFGRQQ